VIEELTLDAIELPAGDKAILSLQLPAEFIIVFEPVTHSAQFIDVKGRANARAPGAHPWSTITCGAPHRHHGDAPGQIRLSLENRTNGRVLPSIWIANDAMHNFIGKRRAF